MRHKDDRPVRLEFTTRGENESASKGSHRERCLNRSCDGMRKAKRAHTQGDVNFLPYR